MRSLFVVLHVVICFILIMVVLLQAGRGASMGAAFGGASQTLFGSTGAGTFLGKMTTVVAVIFMLTTLSLSYFTSEKSSSVVKGYKVPQATEQALPKQGPSPVRGAAPVAPAASDTQVPQTTPVE
ncbi:MAG: preprotein translocase subunit SecG [Deltaproteobacteria bacterium]|jgi:preprotein translocase subunit SecG|nr:preprotein translocase subunit SecG [Deltaproteobacteria bacterium]